MDQNHFSTVGTGAPKKHFTEIILKLVYEEMPFKGFSIMSFGCHFVPRSGTILDILVEGHQGTFMRNYFECPLVQEEKSIKGFSIFSSDGHFVQRSGTILAILVEGL